MAQDQLDLTPQDTLALSAAMRRPLTDLFTRIRAIAAHEEMLTPYLRQELEVLLRDGYRLLRLADSLSTVECYELPPQCRGVPAVAAAAGVPGEHPAAAGRQWPYPVLRSPGGE